MAPLGWSLALFGESRPTIAMVPLLYAVGTVILFGLSVRHRFGGTAATIAGCVLALAPVFMQRALQPNIDIVELFWVLASVCALQRAADGERAGLAAIAGACLAMAICSRMSALALVPIFAIAFLVLPAMRYRFAIAFGCGLAALLATEAALYWQVTGNPFTSWQLSLHHTRIPSSELAAHVDLTQSPLLNPAFIGGWKRAAGIEVHWTIDPVLNLLAHPQIGLSLLGVPLLWLAAGRNCVIAPQRRRWLAYLLGAAGLHFFLLAYVLAIDPKPRMFLPEIAVAAAVSGLFAAQLWHAGQRFLPAMLLGLLFCIAVLFAAQRVDFRKPERMAAAWVSQDMRRVALTEFTARAMTLAPGLKNQPVYPAPGAEAVIALAAEDCIAGAGGFNQPGWKLERSARYPAWPTRVANDAAILCLFRRIS